MYMLERGSVLDKQFGGWLYLVLCVCLCVWLGFFLFCSNILSSLSLWRVMLVGGCLVKFNDCEVCYMS